MLAPSYISKATEAVRNVRDSVEMVRSGKIYMPTVKQCVAELGRVPATAMVKLQLVRLNSLVNAARPLTDDMIDAFAPLIIDRIMEDDVSINLADLRIIFDNAAMGRYGKIFGGFGINDVIGWIDQYIIDKCDCIEEWHRKTFDEPVGERRAEDPKSIRDSFHQANVWFQMQNKNQDKNNK